MIFICHLHENMPPPITVYGKGPVVAVFDLNGYTPRYSFSDNIISSITLTGLITPEGKMDILAWLRFSETTQDRFVRLSKKGKVLFACLGMDGTRKGIIDDVNGRVRFVS